jgi:hypothetical protein
MLSVVEVKFNSDGAVSQVAEQCAQTVMGVNV